MNRHSENQHLFKPTLISLVTSLVLLGGCSSDSDKEDPAVTGTEIAIVATAISGSNAVGAHAAISTTVPFTAQKKLVPTDTSDITVSAFGANFYRIERFQGDNITRFAVSDPATVITQFKTMNEGEEGSSNPHALVFESDNKAYLMRFGKTEAWVVNPLAATQAEFKTDIIDLSAYDPGDGSVEMTAGVVSEGKLFILMQRLDETWAPQEAYVAVIDTKTNKEIDTKTNNANKGILLPIINPHSIQLDDNGEIYIGAIGNAYTTPPQYTGGIVTLDSETYEVSMLVDDGDAENHPYHNFSDIEIVSPTKGYFVSYKGWKDNALYAFNPVTGVVDAAPIEGMSGINLSGLASDSKDRLWVSVSSSADRSAGVRVYNSTDDTLVGDEIALELNPLTIVFGQKPE